MTSLRFPLVVVVCCAATASCLTPNPHSPPTVYTDATAIQLEDQQGGAFRAGVSVPLGGSSFRAEHDQEQLVARQLVASVLALQGSVDALHSAFASGPGPVPPAVAPAPVEVGFSPDDLEAALAKFQAELAANLKPDALADAPPPNDSDSPASGLPDADELERWNILISALSWESLAKVLLTALCVAEYRRLRAAA